MSNVKHCANPYCGRPINVTVKNYGNKKYCSDTCRFASNPNSSVAGPTRKCHDCKRPVDDYRCPDCLRKWRMAHGVSIGDYGVTALDIEF